MPGLLKGFLSVGGHGLRACNYRKLAESFENHGCIPNTGVTSLYVDEILNVKAEGPIRHLT